MSQVYQLLINSADRIAGTSTDFNVPLHFPLQDIKGVKLLSASIPNTIYNVTSSNNTIYWTRGIARSATITAGAYDVNTLISEIETSLQTVDPAQTYTVTYDQTLMKITIACDAAIVLTCTNTTNAIWEVVGFNTDSNTASANSHLADNVVRLDFPAYLAIRINELLNPGTISTTGYRCNFVVSLAENSSTVETFNVGSDYLINQNYTSNNFINTLNISLRKPTGETIDLNGADWAMLLEFVY